MLAVSWIHNGERRMILIFTTSAMNEPQVDKGNNIHATVITQQSVSISMKLSGSVNRLMLSMDMHSQSLWPKCKVQKIKKTGMHIQTNK